MSSSPPLFQSSSPADVSSALAPYSLTPTQLTTLQTSSVAAKATAYCLYSHFRVGATILTSEGEYISGANVENASYPVGTCAERVAFGKAVVDGKIKVDRGYDGSKDGERMKGTGGKVVALAVATDISPPASPCGMCRQFIREFCELDTPIFMFDKDGAFVVLKLGELLPLSFGPEQLPAPGTNKLQ